MLLIFLLINYLPNISSIYNLSILDISRIINFCFKIAFNKKEEIVDVQTIGNSKREEITLSTWINVPLDVSISFRYLFFRRTNRAVLSGIHTKRKKEEIEIEQSGQKI